MGGRGPQARGRPGRRSRAGRPCATGRGRGNAATHVHSVLCVEHPEGAHPLELLRLARPGQRGALPGRLQPGLSHLPQRRPGLAARAAPGAGPGRGARLAQGAGTLAGRPDRHRRRAHPGRRAGDLPGGPEARRRPARQAGHQRHAARRGRGPALRGPGRRVRGGREGPVRQISGGDRRPGRRGRRPAQPGMDLRPGPTASGPFLFPHHHGSGLGRVGPRRHPGTGPGRRGPCAAILRSSGEGTCPSRF